jgi:hypothetical protein
MKEELVARALKRADANETIPSQIVALCVKRLLWRLTATRGRRGRIYCSSRRSALQGRLCVCKKVPAGRISDPTVYVTFSP